MKPQELVDLMNKEFPHLKTRLGTSEDQEVNSTLISFGPRSTPSKTNTPPEKSDTSGEPNNERPKIINPKEGG